MDYLAIHIDSNHRGLEPLTAFLAARDIESLLIQQIEFCTTLVLNKTDTVTPEQIAELKAIVRGLQKDAAIVEAKQGNVPMDELLDIADAGLLMPPKSTWFEPKLRSGLFIHEI